MPPRPASNKVRGPRSALTDFLKERGIKPRGDRWRRRDEQVEISGHVGPAGASTLTPAAPPDSGDGENGMDGMEGRPSDDDGEGEEAETVNGEARDGEQGSIDPSKDPKRQDPTQLAIDRKAQLIRENKKRKTHIDSDPEDEARLKRVAAGSVKEMTAGKENKGAKALTKTQQAKKKSKKKKKGSDSDSDSSGDDLYDTGPRVSKRRSEAYASLCRLCSSQFYYNPDTVEDVPSICPLCIADGKKLDEPKAKGKKKPGKFSELIMLEDMQKVKSHPCPSLQSHCVAVSTLSIPPAKSMLKQPRPFASKSRTSSRLDVLVRNHETRFAPSSASTGNSTMKLQRYFTMWIRVICHYMIALVSSYSINHAFLSLHLTQI